MKTLVGFPDDDGSNEENKQKEENNMPKINFGMADAADVEASQGFPVYKGDLPPNGAYQAAVKVVKIDKIGSGNDKGKSRLKIVAIIDDPEYPEYKGCPAFGNLNLTEQGASYVNQFLESLTDGSEAQKKAVRNAFWKTGPIVDDAKEHIVRIGKVQVNSPRGELVVVIGTRHNTWQGNTTLQINQWMLAGENEGSGSDDEDDESNVVEADDDSVVEVDDAESEDDDEGDEEDGDGEDPYADEDSE